MADIKDLLAKILSSRYGKDVRGAIHDSIEKINDIAETYEGGAQEALKEAKEQVTLATEQASSASTSAGEASQSLEECKQIEDRIGSFVSYGGNIAFADLPDASTLTKPTNYNISDEFTSDERFTDGGGIKYPAGTNVINVTGSNLWDVQNGTYQVDSTLDITSANPVENKVVAAGFLGVDAMQEELYQAQSDIRDNKTNLAEEIARAKNAETTLNTHLTDEVSSLKTLIANADKVSYVSLNPSNWDTILSNAQKGHIEIYGINSTKTYTGEPSGAYTYGTMITIGSYTNTYSSIQIYMPDSRNSTALYIRTRPSARWLKYTGTEVSPVS